MDGDSLVTTDLSSNVRQLRLNQPNKLNALDKDLLRTIAKEIRAAADYQVLIITGTGDAFTAGADLDEAQTEGEDAELFQELTRVTRDFEGLVIGKLHGWVVGGGFEWTLSFDLRYAAEDTTFKMTESEVGLPISNASTLYLPLMIGAGRARELVYTSRELPAEEAKEIGLVNDTFPSDTIDEEVLAIAEDVVENKSSLALRLNKQGLNQAFPVERILSYESVLGDLSYEMDSESLDW
jgi:enoyl-CoA hydratase/carnithine racemase